MTLSLSIFLACALSLLINQWMEGLTRSIRVVGTYAQLSLTHNPHIAFGIALPNWLEALLIFLALLAVLKIALGAPDTKSKIAFGVIIGGAIANILDRLPDGLVTDYVSIGTFPVFNMADICITLGAAFLVLEGIWTKRRLI